MTAIGYIRGHLVQYLDDEWRFPDGTVVDPDATPCVSCGRLPTPEGHDACLGTLPRVIAACCGHGRPEDAYTLNAPGCPVADPFRDERTGP